MPVLDGCNRRHIGKTDAEAYAEAETHINLPQRFGLGGKKQAGSPEQDADQRHLTRPKNVGERAAYKAENEIERDRDRENERDRSPLRRERLLQRREERREAVGYAKCHEHHAKGADDHAPATLLRAPLLYGNDTVDLLPNTMPIHRSAPHTRFFEGSNSLTRSVGLVARYF